jgi:hypothetical protein
VTTIDRTLLPASSSDATRLTIRHESQRAPLGAR